MSAGLVWWMQIGNSIRFLDAIANALRDTRSTVLDLRQELPWREDFYEAVDVRRASHTGHRRLIRKEWHSGAIPGRFLLDEICTSQERAEYYPGWTFAQYLSASDIISIRDYYVWITDIHNKSDMRKWMDFIREYDSFVRESERHMTFILEYDGPTISYGGIERIEYSVQKYDCRIFSMAAAVAVDNTRYIDYQSELAISLSGDDPELCWAMIQMGNNLLIDPISSMNLLMSNGAPRSLDIQTIKSRVWEAGLIHLFPRIEQYRMAFIEKHADVLRPHLPFDNGNGEMIYELEDLELGNIWYLINQHHGLCSTMEYQAIKLCRGIRNILAHNRVVPFESIEGLYSLE